MASTRRKLIIRLMAASTVLLVLVVAGWLWVQWPVWTAERFIRHARAREYVACYEMFATPRDKSLAIITDAIERVNGELSVDRRSAEDIIFGRTGITDRHDWNVVVQNGHLIPNTLTWDLFGIPKEISDKRHNETLRLLRQAQRDARDAAHAASNPSPAQ